MPDFLPVDCPNCGDTVDIALDELEFLHDGVVVNCPACDRAITFVLIPEWVKPQAVRAMFASEKWNAVVRALSNLYEGWYSFNLPDRVIFARLVRLLQAYSDWLD